MPKLLVGVAAVFAVVAAGAAVAGFFLPASCGIQGAYFDRSTGAPSNLVISTGGVCWAPDFLLGAAAAFAVAAVALAVLGVRLRRRGAS